MRKSKKLPQKKSETMYCHSGRGQVLRPVKSHMLPEPIKNSTIFKRFMGHTFIALGYNLALFINV